MRKFRDLSLYRKLTVIIMLSTVSAVLVSSVAIVAYQVHTFTRSVIAELETTADILGSNGAAALRFGIERDARLTLESLEAKGHISGACFFTPDEKVFSSYSKDGAQITIPTFPLEEGHTFQFDADRVCLVKHVYHDGDLIGSVHIQSDLDIFYDQLWRSITTTFLILVTCASLALVLANKHLRVISRPINDLVDTANRVSETRDYSLRVSKYADDDLGKLTEEFNDMLHQIQIREAELEQEINERKRVQAELEAQRALSVRADRLHSLGEMAAGIAHELNQPLVGVRGLAEHILIALDRGWPLSDQKLNERAQSIVDQADRMTHIIEHVRMFARESGKAELSPVEINRVVLSGIELMNAHLVFRRRINLYE